MPPIRPSIAIAALGTTAFVLFVLFGPLQSHRSKDYGARIACLSNVKQIGYAHLLYAEDHDERYSPVQWVPAIRPRLREEGVLQCPIASKQGGSGYAYNRLLAGVKLTEVDQPADTALTFEVDDLRLGAVADRVTPLRTHRHADRLVAAFADGHAKSLAIGYLGKVRMRPRPIP